MILHICLDGNNIAHSLSIFERYYPGQSVVVLFNTKDKRNYPGTIPIYRFDLKKNVSIQNILGHYQIDYVILHGIVYSYISVLDQVKSIYTNARVYWLYWGYELYAALADKGNYKLLDNFSVFSPISYLTPSPYSAFMRRLMGRMPRTEALEKALPYIDYFCFWFKPDYELLQRFYHTGIKFKHFQYGAVNTRAELEAVPDYVPVEKKEKIIMVNHQASLNGNYGTIFSKLKSISDIDDYTISVPLSYGSSYVRKNVLKQGKKQFGTQFSPLLQMMPMNEYNNYLRSVRVAIFGQLRQEAAGNLATLFGCGAKVFLREDNPLYAYYKEKGYLVFSVDNELKSSSDLEPLSPADQIHNMKLANVYRRCYDDFMPNLFNIQ